MSSLEILEDVGQPAEIGRHLIASIRGFKPGPTLLIVGSIHGNEPAGTIAAHRVLNALRARTASLCGEVILLAGNTRALGRGVRYIDADLNRHWTPDHIAAVKSATIPASAVSETLELRELFAELGWAFERARGEICFVDLHTTSAHGVPFATVGDTLRNRRFALNFPVTIVLGLEEQLDGTLLEHMNNLGAVTMGLEAGQHPDESSVDNHEAVIWLAAVAAGNLRREEVPEFDRYRSLLEQASGGARIVEVRHRQAIKPADEFRMEPGFENFQPVHRGEILAVDRHGPIAAVETGIILMPLYQALGDDGFFLGRKVKPFWLKLSALLRQMRVGDYVHLLPGVRRDREHPSTLTVNTRIARILPLQVFHLLGFRKRRWSGNHLIVSKRRYDLVGPSGWNWREFPPVSPDNLQPKYPRIPRCSIDRPPLKLAQTYVGEEQGKAEQASEDQPQRHVRQL